ncbi:hypothetical protein OAD06_04305 [Flavobacteriaceae bacterium]|nr:hypothetical protein [Flavobacteriaceae bacterium]|tara:strand:- start:79 stop:654 length:576 start_codon:yes stop_codon:yes gene_type:complete
MKKLVLMFFCLLIALGSFAQTSSKPYNKDIAEYRAKAYLIKNVLNNDAKPILFEMEALSSASSGELTSLYYSNVLGIKSSVQNKKEGLILGFFSDRWNPQGVIFNQYNFKNIPEINAKELLQLISLNIDIFNSIKVDYQNNYNFYFEFDDLIVLLYKINGSLKIRVFWGDFDADWDSTAFNRTYRRFLKKT